MDARAVPRLPSAEGWQFEIKFDGYRVQAIKTRGETHLHSRRGNLMDDRFAIIREAISLLESPEFILDGEVVAIDDTGRCDFNLLQLAKAHQCRLHFYAFDILSFEGRDLGDLPLLKRRAILEREFRTGGRFHLSPIFHDPEALLAAVREFGFEGVMAKHLGSSYEEGERTGAWQKKKTQPSDDFVIGGMVLRDHAVDELVVGRKTREGLKYMASVKSGFVPVIRKQVFAAEKPLKFPMSVHQPPGDEGPL